MPFVKISQEHIILAGPLGYSESDIHDHFADYRVGGEWFIYSDDLKLFVDRIGTYLQQQDAWGNGGVMPTEKPWTYLEAKPKPPSQKFLGVQSISSSLGVTPAMPNSIPNRYYDIQSPVLRGDKKNHLLQPYHASMQAEVAACNVAFPNGLLLVTSKSPKPYKQAVERTAWFFKREMRYDFPQYAATEYDRSPYSDPKTDADLRAFLWFEDEHSDRAANEWPMIGAAAFRLKGLKKKQLWFFDWVWIHPYERRRGHLERTWPFLCSMFGNFAFTEPVSYSMQRFLVKMNQKEENPDN